MNTSDFGANVFDEPQGPSHPDDEAHKAAGRTRKRSPRKKKVAAEAEEDTAQARPAAESGPVAELGDAVAHGPDGTSRGLNARAAR